MYIYTYTNFHIHLDAHIDMCVYFHVHIQIYVYTCSYPSIHLFIYPSVCLCVLAEGDGVLCPRLRVLVRRPLQLHLQAKAQLSP